MYKQDEKGAYNSWDAVHILTFSVRAAPLPILIPLSPLFVAAAGEDVGARELGLNLPELNPIPNR